MKINTILNNKIKVCDWTIKPQKNPMIDVAYVNRASRCHPYNLGARVHNFFCYIFFSFLNHFKKNVKMIGGHGGKNPTIIFGTFIKFQIIMCSVIRNIYVHIYKVSQKNVLVFLSLTDVYCGFGIATFHFIGGRRVHSRL